MKMPNMANGRDGFPCSLNPVGDIFQRGTLPFETEASIDLEDASQEKKVLVGQIADSAASPRPFRREMSKDLNHLYQMNKLDCISEGYTGTGCLSICTKAVSTPTTYTQGKASSELVKAVTHKAKGNSRNQSPFFLAGPLSLIFSSVNVMASDSAEVTVSMTSEASKTSGKCDSGSHLGSPKLASAKYRQHRSAKPEVTVTSRNVINGLASVHVEGVCQDNLLNRKPESAFVQAADIAQTLCVTIGNSQNQQGLGSLRPRHVQKNDFRTLEDVLVTKKKKGSIRSATLRHGEEVGQLWDSCLALLRNRRLISPRMEVTIKPALLSCSSLRESICSTTSLGTLTVKSCDLEFLFPVAITYSLLFRCVSVYTKKPRGKASTCVSPRRNVIHTLILIRSKNSGAQKDCTPFRASNHNVTEAYTMAFLHSTQTRPKFTDTYWIVPCYETASYGKVSFTRQDRRIFIAMFKDSRLIWAGRQPVNDFTQGLKDPKSQKVGVKHTMSHEGIEKISIPQGTVKITPPSTPTITNIVTVPATVSDIATVQEVVHV